MSTLFIADLHLSEQQPVITAGFLKFLLQEARQADALYILGDLFEYWIGDDNDHPLYHQIAHALHELTSGGIPCYFTHGNRDFLLGAHFAHQCGMTLLPEKLTLSLYGQSVLVMHGDTLCTGDHNYLRFRKYSHNPLVKKLFLRLPLKLRLKIVERLREHSQHANIKKASAIMDATPQAVVTALIEDQATWLIHGHTHCPAIHTISLPNHSLAYRAVLGAWHSQGSMIRVSANGVELIEFPF